MGNGFRTHYKVSPVKVKSTFPYSVKCNSKGEMLKIKETTVRSRCHRRVFRMAAVAVSVVVVVVVVGGTVVSIQMKEAHQS